MEEHHADGGEKPQECELRNLHGAKIAFQIADSSEQVAVALEACVGGAIDGDLEVGGFLLGRMG